MESKKKYVEMEMNVMEIDANDIITKSNCYDCECNSPGECNKDYKYNGG